MEFDMKTLIEKHQNGDSNAMNHVVKEIEKRNLTGCYRSIEEHYIRTGKFPMPRELSACSYHGINAPPYTECDAFRQMSPTTIKGLYLGCYQNGVKQQWSVHVTHEYFKKN